MSEIRNELLADIITAAGGTATDTSNRNQLLMDWFSAAKGGEFVASLNGSDQYWQLNEDIVIAEGADFHINFNSKFNHSDNQIFLGKSSSTNGTILISGNYLRARADNGDLQDYLIGGQSPYNIDVIRSSGDIHVYIDGAKLPEVGVGITGSFTFNRIGRYATDHAFYLDGYLSKLKISIDGQLINHIRLTNKNQGAYQVAATTPLGDNLYTPSDIENPDAIGAQWSYLGDGRWYLDGDGDPSALIILPALEQPTSGYVQFEIESISGGTLTCARTFNAQSVFDSAGVKTFYYSNLSDIAEIQFKRGSGAVQAVIKNIKHYDADGVLVASMVGYDDSVWITDPSPDNSAQYKSRNEILNMIAAAYGTSSNQNLSRNDYLNMILTNLGGSPESMTRNDILESIIERLQ